jgi:hypothetical protein
MMQGEDRQGGGCAMRWVMLRKAAGAGAGAGGGGRYLLYVHHNNTCPIVSDQWRDCTLLVLCHVWLPS